jgi:hypothetical protein
MTKTSRSKESFEASDLAEDSVARLFRTVAYLPGASINSRRWRDGEIAVRIAVDMSTHLLRT